MLISEAFSKFQAKQKNVNWSVSSFNDSGELVVSLWEQYFHKTSRNGKPSMTYIDRVTRWNGAGQKEFIRNLNSANESESTVRAIIAKTNHPEVVEKGGDASKLKNSFSPKLDWIGQINDWDGDNFEIEFIRS
jgi:hypothetical protein